MISCEKVRERFTCPETFASSVLDFTERVEVFRLRVGCDLARMGGVLFVVLRHVLDVRMVGICGLLLSCGDHAKIVSVSVFVFAFALAMASWSHVSASQKWHTSRDLFVVTEQKLHGFV